MQLRYQGVVKLIPACAWVSLLALAGAVAWMPPTTALQWFIYSLMMLLLATFTVWLTAEVWRSQIGINERQLVIRKQLKRTRRVPWEAVARIEYQRLWSAFVIVTDTGERFYVSTMMNNLSHFITMMAAALPRDKYIESLDSFAQALRGNTKP